MKHPAPQRQKRNTKPDPQHQKPEWATFTYIGKETRKISKLFKDTKIKIAFRTRNTIQNIIKQHIPNEKPRLPTKIHRTNRQNFPQQIQGAHTCNQEQ
jgi:hypothetical protein